MGLVQGEIEASGFSTISLSIIPELTASTAAPRIAAIEHPFGLTMGAPGDAAGQLAVLRAALRALAEISEPGAVVNLPFAWDSAIGFKADPPEPPPLVPYLTRHPWLFPRFMNRKPPEPPGHG